MFLRTLIVFACLSSAAQAMGPERAMAVIDALRADFCASTSDPSHTLAFSDEALHTVIDVLSRVNAADFDQSERSLTLAADLCEGTRASAVETYRRGLLPEPITALRALREQGCRGEWNYQLFISDLAVKDGEAIRLRDHVCHGDPELDEQALLSGVRSRAEAGLILIGALRHAGCSRPEDDFVRAVTRAGISIEELPYIGDTLFEAALIHDGAEDGTIVLSRRLCDAAPQADLDVVKDAVLGRLAPDYLWSGYTVFGAASQVNRLGGPFWWRLVRLHAQENGCRIDLSNRFALVEDLSHTAYEQTMLYYRYRGAYNDEVAAEYARIVRSILAVQSPPGFTVDGQVWHLQDCQPS